MFLAGRNYQWFYLTLKKKLLLPNVKNIKNGIYFEKVIDELKTPCNSREAEYSYDGAKTRPKFNMRKYLW